MFSALLHDEVVTIAQVTAPDGTNETTQADTLLDDAGIPEGESVLVTEVSRTAWHDRIGV